VAAAKKNTTAPSVQRQRSTAGSGPAAQEQAFGFARLLRMAADELATRQRDVDERRLVQVAVRAAAMLRNRSTLEAYARAHGVTLVYVGAPPDTDELALRVGEHVAERLADARKRRDAFAAELLLCRRGRKKIAQLFGKPEARTRAKRTELLAQRDQLLSLSVGLVRGFLDHQKVSLEQMVEVLFQAREAQHHCAESRQPAGLRDAAVWNQELISIVESDLPTAGKIVSKNGNVGARGGPRNQAIFTVATFCGMPYATVRKVVERRGSKTPLLLVGVAGPPTAP
jgi:hypothetical protein